MNLPASLSKELVDILLRKECGFNGMVVTDASSMLGFSTAMPRSMALPAAIMSGIDMILFSIDLKEDYNFMLNAFYSGILTKKRLDEAVTRILGVKASLGLFNQKRHNQLLPDKNELGVIRCTQHVNWAIECADKAITLVRDTKHLLPLNSKKFKRILLYSMESEKRACDTNVCKLMVKSLLEKEGFQVDAPEDCFAPPNPDSRNISYIKEHYDLALYILSIQNASYRTTLRLDWFSYPSCSLPWFTGELPTVAVSFGNPYHLYDIPHVHTYINCYSFNVYTVEMLMKKILGKSEFKGINPVPVEF